MRREEAARLLNDSALSEAFDEAIAQIIELWSNSPSEDTAGREACYREIRGLKAVRVRLQANMQAAVKE